MKSGLFKYSVLTIGIVTALGIATSANAAKLTADSAPTIDNIATATYSIGGVAQTPVVSNKVTVNITQSAAFNLTATNEDGDIADDYNKNATVTPKGRTAFNHTLTNSGNVEDTYTLSLAQKGIVPGITTVGAGSYDLDSTNVTYTVFDKDNNQISTKTVTGTAFQQTAITLKPNQYAKITISAKTVANIGGDLQNLTLSAKSAFFTARNPANSEEATLQNVDNSTTKVPVFKITSSVSNTLNLNDPSSKTTYTVKILNDGSATYAAAAQGIIVFDGLPAGLRLADSPNMTVSNGASIIAGNGGKGGSSAKDSVEVTLLNLAIGETATITFDVQRDTTETLVDPKNIVNHAVVKLDLGEGGIIYDTTDPADSLENTSQYYPATDDSEVLDGSANNVTGGDSTAPLTANQRALTIEDASKKEIPTNTSTITQVIHSAVIRNTGKEIEGDKAGEIKFTISPIADGKVTVVAGSVELIYDPDGKPDTPNFVYTISRDVNGDNDLSTAKPKNNAPVWSGMVPGSAITINYKVESKNAVIDTIENVKITLVPGGNDVPTTGNHTVTNETTVRGLKLEKTQALNESCNASATLNFTKGDVLAKPSDCIVYKITAFNTFSADDARFTFTNTKISDDISQFKNKAQVLSASTDPIFAIKLDNVSGNTAEPSTNKYQAQVTTTEVTGTVTNLAPQEYAALMFSVKINASGAEVTRAP